MPLTVSRTLARRVLLFATAGTLGLQYQARGQVPTAASCSYDTCALRLRYDFLRGARVVQGSAGLRVSLDDLLAAHMSVLADPTDSITVHYQAFRSNSQRARVLLMLGSVSLVVAHALARDNDERVSPEPMAFLSFGLASTVAGVIHGSRANEHLSRAIWLYNRGLPR